jgi:hypothetical protein
LTETPVNSRSWIDPGWGKIVHRVRPFQYGWQKSEWFQHIGVQGVLWAGACLLLGISSAAIEVLFGHLSFAQAAQNIAKVEPIVALLGVGFLAAILVRWLEQGGWANGSAHSSQAEIYTNGLYLTPYGFVGGLHPFFPWSDIRNVDVIVDKRRRYVMLSLQLRELRRAGQIRLDADAVAELLAIPEVGDAETPLAEALRQSDAALKAK